MMLDTRMVGINISNLRKEKDMTQMELADELNVSHQAVSKWERGESMPDIGTLPEIANFFGVSVDFILGNSEVQVNEKKKYGKHTEGELVMELSQGSPHKVATMINEDSLPIDSVIELAPIIKSSAMDRIFEEVDLMNKSSSMEKIAELAPFLGKETLERITFSMLENNPDQEILSELLPHLSRDAKIKMVESVKNGKLDLDFLMEIVPFLRSEDINSLVDSVLEKEFHEELLIELLPFIGKEKLPKVAEQIMTGKLQGIEIVDIAPFLGKEVLSDIIEQIMKKK